MTKKEFIEESIEFKICKKQIIFFICLYLFVSLFISIPYLLISGVEIFDLWEVFGIASLIFIILFFPFIMYYAYRAAYMKKMFKNYLFLEVEFKEMHGGFTRFVYFTVLINTDGKQKKIDTRSFFSVSPFNFIYPNFEEYLNKKVMIAYDKINEEIVVIKAVK